MKALKMHETMDYLNNNHEETKQEDINNNEMKPSLESVNIDENSNENSDEEPNIIPWRAQLRKTNSKLNLLD